MEKQEIHASTRWPILMCYDESGQMVRYKSPSVCSGNNQIIQSLIKSGCVKISEIKPVVQRFGYIVKGGYQNGAEAFSPMYYPDLDNGKKLSKYIEQVLDTGMEYIILFDFFKMEFFATKPSILVNLLQDRGL